MKKVLIMAAALAAASATAASAADLAVRPTLPAKAVPMVEVPTWAGPYIGLHAGYLSGGGEYTFPGSSEFHFIDPKGFAGGPTGVLITPRRKSCESRSPARRARPNPSGSPPA